MPLIEISIFEDELSKDQIEEVIKAMTDTMVSFSGEGLRSATWVIVHEIKSGNWGIGGNALGLKDVREIQAATGKK